MLTRFIEAAVLFSPVIRKAGEELHRAIHVHFTHDGNDPPRLGVANERFVAVHDVLSIVASVYRALGNSNKKSSLSLDRLLFKHLRFSVTAGYRSPVEEFDRPPPVDQVVSVILLHLLLRYHTARQLSTSIFPLLVILAGPLAVIGTTRRRL
jgi:hypothetical protein